MGGVILNLALAEQREQKLDELLHAMGSVLVAFSGGVDSSYLAVRAHRVLGSRALSVTADSESLAEEQRSMAHRVVRDFGLQHRVVQTHEMEDAEYVRNEGTRCFRCKTELFKHLVPLAQEEGLAHVVYGAVVDDLSDFRPGHEAARQAGIRSPLIEAEMAKADVRARSAVLGLPTWDQPASPCLSSRIPYGTPVTTEALRAIERAETAVRGLGYREFRVRHLGLSARVELAPQDLASLDNARREKLQAMVRTAGYRDVVIDPGGYRRGRLNETLKMYPSA